MHLITRTIFCPNQYHFEKSFAGIINIFDNISIDDNIIIYIIGWCKIDKYKESIVKLLNTTKITIYHDILPFNYGKLFVYKKIREFVQKHSQINSIIYTDHDIIFEQKISSFFEILDSNVDNIKPFGLNAGVIFINQIEDNRHQSSIYDNVICLNDYSFVYPDKKDISSVASGAFYITPNCLKCLDSLDINIVYGMDEYFLLQNIIKNGYYFAVIHELTIIHPFSNDSKYEKWKFNCIKEIIQKINHGQIIEYNYNDKILESHNFWS